MRGRPGPGSGGGAAFHLESTLELGSLPTAIPCARLHARNVLMEWGLRDLVADAELVVSELMTNALEASIVLPGVPPITLRLLADDNRLLIEAWDRSPQDLELHDADGDAEHGRGLAVVAALSQQWGVRRVGYNSKAVWCALKIAPALPAVRR